jgi:hypothetical protein
MHIYTTHRAKDCGVAAFANYFGLNYEDVYSVAVKLFPAFARRRDGIGVHDLITLATAFKLVLYKRHWRRVDLDDHNGILGVTWNDPKEHGCPGHWVVLRNGLILDSEGPCYDEAEKYLTQYHGRVGTLLTESL